MTPEECEQADLPAKCEHRFSVMETKLDQVLVNQKATSRRAWDIIKGLVLLISGFLLASFRSGK